VGQDLPTLYIWGCTTDWGLSNRQNTNLLLFSSNPNPSFPNPNFLSPFIPAVLRGGSSCGSSWSADARSTQDASSLMGSLLERRFLVQPVEVVYRSDWQYIPVWPIRAPATRSFCTRSCSCVTAVSTPGITKCHTWNTLWEKIHCISLVSHWHV
jgi:hypothetical protein